MQINSFLDLHTHTRYPGIKFIKQEDIEQAAKNGGYSEILAMPNSSKIIDSLEALEEARKLDSSLSIEVHRTASLTKGLAGQEPIDYKKLTEHGVFIFTDDGLSVVDDNLAETIFRSINEVGAAVFQHCEKSCHTMPGDIAPPNDNSHLKAIHISEETEILNRDLKLVEKYGTRYHAQHLSTIESVELIREAKINNLPVTAEVTPHHLLANNENLDTSDGKYKMYPPIRTENDRLALIAGLKDGTIDVISTDHAPHPKNDKVVNFKEASRGVVGLESSFPMLYSSKIFNLDDLVMFLDINPRKILSDIGYKINQMRTFEWKICDKEFYTISEPKNSLFEGNATLIETDGIYV